VTAKQDKLRIAAYEFQALTSFPSFWHICHFSATKMGILARWMGILPTYDAAVHRYGTLVPSLYLSEIGLPAMGNGASAEGSPGRCCSQKIYFQMSGEDGPP
jgi:hypothetical protein